MKLVIEEIWDSVGNQVWTKIREQKKDIGRDQIWDKLWIPIWRQTTLSIWGLIR